jgi:hypothetical protein
MAPSLLLLRKQMLLTLPPEIVFEIAIRLDYTCFPKILHVNRQIRTWVLENWLRIHQKRLPSWREQTPEDSQQKINSSLLNIPKNWSLIQNLVVLKATLLKGAQVDYRPSNENDILGGSCFYSCMCCGFVELADIRNPLCSYY